MALVLTGAIAWWTLAAVRIVRFQRVLRDVEPMPGDWQARTDELAERLGLAVVRRLAWCRAGCRRCSGRSVAGRGSCCRQNSGRP